MTVDDAAAAPEDAVEATKPVPETSNPDPLSSGSKPEFSKLTPEEFEDRSCTLSEVLEPVSQHSPSDNRSHWSHLTDLRDR